MYEGEKRAFPYTMTYGDNWSGQAADEDPGDPIKKAHVSRVIFSIRRKKDALPFVTLYDRDENGTDTPDEIAWVDVAAGTIRIKLNDQTEEEIAHDAIFQLRVNWVAGGFTILDTDTIDILDVLTL